MKRGVMLLVVLLFSVSFVFAANDWGGVNIVTKDYSEIDDLGDEEVVIKNEDVEDEDEDEDEDVAPPVSGGVSSVSAFEYTLNFYIALGVGTIGLFIVILFVYLFARSPKNKWKKRP